MTLKGSVTVSKKLAASLTEAKKMLKNFRAEVGLLEEQVERTEAEKAGPKKVVAED